MEHPLETITVSVIIPTYNRAKALQRCLDSLSIQTYKRFEVLVCDDGSTDDTEQIVGQFKNQLDITYYKNENFGGPAKPRNTGIQHATGKYLAFLDSDDWWTPEKLEKSVQALEAGADIVYHDLYRMLDGVRKPIFREKVKTWSVKAPVFDDLLFNGNAISNSSVVVRSDFMKKIGGFSEDKQLIAAEDYDAWLGIARLTDKFVRLPSCLGYYTVGKDNLTSSNRTMMTIKKRLDLDKNTLNGFVPLWVNRSLCKVYFNKRSYICAFFELIKWLSKSAYFKTMPR